MTFPSMDVAAGWLNLRNGAVLVGLWLAYQLLRATYNISPLHPLHQFPGPKAASMSYLYEFYFDVLLWGRYTHEIRRMHQTYGPIVRINPDELHCNDAGFIDEIYPVASTGRSRNKPQHQLNAVPEPSASSAFCTADHDLHRRRSLPLCEFFSKERLSNFESEVHHLAQKICDQLLARAKEEKPFDVTMAYSCFTSDVVSACCFGESFGLLERHSFEPTFITALRALQMSKHIFTFFPFLKFTSAAAPFLIKYMPEDIALLTQTIYVDIPNRIRTSKAELDAGLDRDKSIFDVILRSNLPPEEKSIFRITGETIALLTGGTQPGSWALTVITYHLLSKAEILEQLSKELRTIVKDPCRLPSWNTLEKLPYLNAVILEGLRLSYGVSSRTSRIPTNENLIYHSSWSPPESSKSIEIRYLIPQGAAIGMSSAIMHHNEDIFPSSNEFTPGRRLDKEPQGRKDLKKCLLVFSQGSRQCTGLNLAYCELYVLVAALALRVFPRMRMYQTNLDDIRYDHDLLFPMVRKGSRGVRVQVT